MQSMGETIQIFLHDGTPEGLREIQVKGRTARMYIVTRSRLGDLSHWEQPTSKTGVYALVSDDHSTVYIGQSDDVRRRILQHDRDQDDWWNTAILMTTTDDNLHGAVARYLESRLIEIVKNAKRSKIKNGQEPNKPRLSRSDEAFSEGVLGTFLTLLPVNSFYFATPQTRTQSTPASGEATPSAQQADESPIFEMKRSQMGIRARAQEVNGKFFVLKGSQARTEVQPSLSEGIKIRRQQLIEQGLLKAEGNFLIFQEDVEFSSPSTAAGIITGASVNGRNYWQLEGTQTTYGEWSAKRNAEAFGAS